jgi:UDP-glucose 4-epimerase
MRALITGGLGFIGSHLLDRLVSFYDEVTVLDNLHSGLEGETPQSLRNRNMRFILGDCTNPSDVEEAVKDVDVVFHLAANSEVRLELNDPETCFRQNVYATHILLEEVRRSEAKIIVFTSTSTVYGDAEVVPTLENHPARPISIYGASKLASEALITAYAHTYNKRAIILRLANVVGPRSSHGVIHDFVTKLKKDPRELEILGDGTQTKSYLHIEDCIDAILVALIKSEGKFNVINVGSEDQIPVGDVAEIVVEEMGLKDVNFNFTSGVDGGRGWRGDVKNMLLDVENLKSLGWSPKYSSGEAVRKTVKALVNWKFPVD